MPSLKERATDALATARQRVPGLDHTMKMFAYYGTVRGNDEAGAVTYFGFLSFFPILALAFFVVGLVTGIYPDARSQMTDAINSFLPGLIGTGGSSISLKSVQKFSGIVGLIGVLGVLYSGLNWVSALRRALEVLFSVPAAQQPNFLLGKLRDLATLVLIGLTLFVSVIVSGAVTAFTGQLLSLIGINPEAVVPAVLLAVLGHVVGIGATMVLILAMFKLLIAESHAPRRAHLAGALLGAVLFEILKAVASLVLANIQGNAAFATFGVALVLLIWINYFSRFVMYAAAWAYTHPAALAQRTAETMRAPGAGVVASPVTGAESRRAVGAVVAARSAPEPPPAPDPAEQPPARSVSTSQSAARRRPWLVAAGAAALAGIVAVAARGGRGAGS